MNKIKENSIKVENYFIRQFCYETKINKLNFKKLYQEDKKVNFRYICFKFNYFMKSITLPIIKKSSMYEAVFIEFRELPHIEFIIRNAIYRLGSNWAFTVICGNKNYDYVNTICKIYLRILKL